jgi:hypothetical protein
VRSVGDEEFQKAVMARFDHLDGRINALHARMDEVDSTLDDLLRDQSALRTTVYESIDVARRAIERVHEMNRRLIRLEHPDKDEE